MRLIRGLYLSYRFFAALLVITTLFVLGFIWPLFFVIAQAILALLIALVGLEMFVLFAKKEPIEGARKVMNPLSLGDDNKVHISVKNNYGFTVKCVIYDNLPHQLQIRDLNFKQSLSANEGAQFHYLIRPTERGEFKFSDIFVFVSALPILYNVRWLLMNVKLFLLTLVLFK